MSLPAVQAQYVERSHHLHAHLAEVLDETRRVLQADGIGATVHGRLKSPSSTWRKMQRCHLRFDDVYDLVGLRILVGSEDDCYRALDCLLHGWQHRLMLVQDYIASPKENGYRSIHLRATGNDEPPFEVQIRTWGMHEQSEQGPAAHWRYKHSQTRLVATA
ncbi:MAG: hypothetical protein JRI23_09545 [Deltaproteobacteria bacterium]|jgi:(p)ppGpp synthase/HD superfamily hydrolase|nr:hypothetical protein [Deltaproteobacteria bacterium]MBW2531893.1 hypothetical protein [Deltaproteobacteria bacterium]